MERRRILRKPETESRAKQKLEEAGFRRRRDYRGREGWTIAQSRLPTAVRNLVAAGRQVEAEGKLFRNPGSLRLHVSSGIDWFDLRENCRHQFGLTKDPSVPATEGVINCIIACTDVLTRTGRLFGDPLDGNPYLITSFPIWTPGSGDHGQVHQR